MSFKVMIVGFAMMLAAGSVVAFAGEDHAKSVKIEKVNDDVSDAKVKAESSKHHKLSESDFKKVAVKDDKVKTFDEAAFRDDDDEFDGALDDDDDDDSNDTSDDSDGSGTDHASGEDSGNSGSHDDSGADADSGHSGGGDDSN